MRRFLPRDVEVQKCVDARVEVKREGQLKLPLLDSGNHITLSPDAYQPRALPLARMMRVISAEFGFNCICSFFVGKIRELEETTNKCGDIFLFPVQSLTDFPFSL